MLSLLSSIHLASLASRARATARAGKVALFLLSLAMLLASSVPAARGQSSLDGFDPNANGRIWVVFVQPDGKILIGGEFTTLSPNGGPAVTRNRIARLNPDGTVDAAFNPNANTTITSIALQADGKIVVGGGFTGIGGQPRNRIARLDATTGQPDSFDPNANDAIYSVAVQTDGKILAGGVFTSIGGQTRNRIARLDATTGLPDSFNPNANGSVFTITLQADGKILVGGVFSQQAGAITIGGQARNGIARLDPATGLADSFDPNANDSVNSIAVQADGRIVVGGYFQDLGLGAVSIGGEVRNRIARLDPTTGHADSFNPDLNENVTSIAIQPNGKIVIGGFFTRIGGQTHKWIARLDPATGLPDSLNPNGNDHVYSVALQKDGKILAGGDFRTVAPNGEATIARNRIARFEADGRLDQTLYLNLAADRFVLATVVQPDGKILIGGSFSTVLGVARSNIARLNTDGTLDLDFDPNASDQVSAIALQTDGKILVGGIFTSIGGQPRNNMARLDGATGLADAFDPNVSPNFPFGEGVTAIAVQTDGKVLVGGVFNSVSGQTRKNIARLDGATGLADSFDPNASHGVNAIALQADGRIIVGGDFTSIGGQTRRRIARLDATTGLADSFDPNANSFVSSLAVQADGKILVGGFFNDFEGPSTIGGQTRNHIARLDATTGLADSFNPNSNGTPYVIAVQADGKILTGGQFTSIGGQARNHFARLDATTGLADLFDPNIDDSVATMVVQTDGKILAGGFFDTVGGQPRKSFVRLSNDTAAMQELAITQSTVTWIRRGSSQRMARVVFEYSPDNVAYTFLGNGTVAGSNWFLTGLNLPTEVNFFIRARGYHSGGDGSGSVTESVRTVFLKPAAQAINLSTRMRILTGDNVGIGGFIITGTVPKHVLLRAIGTSLGQFGVPNFLGDPMMELHGPSGFATITNDNWRDDPVQEALIFATGLAPTNNLESAIDAILEPGPYTAVVRGSNDTSGVGSVEVYDLSQAANSKLGNISSRAFVGTGDNIMIAGFILGGNSGDDRIVVRGIGPSLVTIGNALLNPTLELRNSNGTLLVFNNDWQDDPAQATELIAAGLAPATALESAIAATLPPGLYTALLAGLNNGTGVGVIEIYDRGAP